MKKKSLVSVFMKHAYRPDFTVTDKSVREALKLTNKQFLKQTKKFKSKRDLIHFYYDEKEGHLIPNHENYELLDFWDAYAPFHTEKLAKNSPLISQVFKIQLLNYKFQLEQDFYFRNRCISQI